MNVENAFRPDWVSPPGETIKDLLADRDMPTSALARALTLTDNEVMELLSGGIELTIDIARNLSSTLGSSVDFWLARESRYREHAERIRLEARRWVSALPVNDMIEYGWIAKVKTLEGKIDECLKFFGVRSPYSWEMRYSGLLDATAFRSSQSFSSKRESVICWLRRGQLEASKMTSSSWDLEGFRLALPGLRAMTRIKNPKIFLPKLREICARFGVLVAIVRAPDGCPVSGATLHFEANKRLLLLSFRYLSDDHFWFTFFHEAGHLILHDQRELILEYKESRSEIEDEANKFAMNTLISPERRRQLMELPATPMAVVRFANAIGLSPGVVVGQLQFSGRVPYDALNYLKSRFSWG